MTEGKIAQMPGSFLGNPISFVLYSWFTPLLFQGWRRTLRFDDLFWIPDDTRTNAIYPAYISNWKRLVQNLESNGPAGAAVLSNARTGKNALLMVKNFIQLHWIRVVCSLALTLVYTVSSFAGPLLLNEIVKFLQTPEVLQTESGRTRAYLLAMAMFLAPMAGSLFNSMANRISVGTQVILRAELNAAIYSKALRLSARARQNMETGKIVNIMSADINQLQSFFYPNFQQLVTCPVTIIVAIVLLWFQIRWATFIGLGVVLLCMPFTGRLVSKMSLFRKRMLVHTDQRVKLMNQLLVAIRVLKMYAWESAQESAILDMRQKELKELQHAIPYRVASISLLFSAPIIAMVLCFSVYGAVEPQNFTPAAIFTSISLFNVMRTPLIYLPFTLLQLANAFVSLRRLTAFLLAEERVDYVELLEKPGIEIQGADFYWAEPPEEVAPQLVTDHGRKEKAPANGKTRQQARGSWLRRKLGMKGMYTTEDIDDAGRCADHHVSTISDQEKVSAETQLSGPEDVAGRPPVLADQKDLEHEGENSASPDVHKAAADLSLFRLHDVNVTVRPGELVCIVGRVGQGKSSLVQAMLGEMEKEQGHVKIGGSVAYCPQQAWIMNATVKANVSFGQPWDEAAWKQAVEASCLAPDLEIMPAGAETEIGEKGINLSGGQKQRVSLARACYQDSDVYILDDPLSAVDVHVGKQIFEQLIDGVLRSKARVLVTNQLQYTPRADHILVVEGGQIVAQGSYTDCLGHSTFAALIREFEAAATEEEDTHDDLENTTAAREMLGGASYDFGKPKNGSRVGIPMLERKQQAGLPAIAEKEGGDLAKESSTGDAEKRNDGSIKDEENQNQSSTVKPKAGALIVSEEKQEGEVAWRVYRRYTVDYGRWAALLLLVLWCGEETVTVLTSWWLSLWTQAVGVAQIDGDHRTPSSTTWHYIGGYIGFGMSYIVLVSVRSGFNLVSSLKASRRIHARALLSVTASPVSFFDTTPVGRVLNRFSKDAADMDFFLPMSLTQLGVCVLSLLGSIIFIAVVQPIILAGLGPLAIVYYLVQKFYRRSYIELQRLDAISRSPIYANFSETLAGAETVRAYGQAANCEARARRQVDDNHRAFWCLGLANEWLSIRLDAMGSILVFLTAVLSISERTDTNVSLVAMTLSQSLTLTQFLKLFVSAAAQFESRFNSVERLMEYADLDSEAPTHIKNTQPPEGWPEAGDVVYQDVWMRYRPGLEPVLRGVTFRAPPGAKLGIVGRTGSGKSSLIVALFRLAEPYKGTILLDNISTLTLGLHDLRSRIAVIPQDPVLFSGTVRSNLDPYGTHDDVALWEALRTVALDDRVRALPGALNARVAESGDNFSVGQRQLVCVARALLRRPRVLVADEATASVDAETDALIQTAIRREFSQCTVLTIAHRINTILDAGTVLVMEAGHVAECDTVASLLANPDSIFKSMVDQTEQARE